MGWEEAGALKIRVRLCADEEIRLVVFTGINEDAFKTTGGSTSQPGGVGGVEGRSHEQTRTQT